MVKLSAADDPERFFCREMEVNQLRDGLDAVDVWEFEFFIGKDDINAMGEGFTDGFKCFTAHEDDVIFGFLAEPSEFFGDVPGQGIVFANGAVFGHGGDHFNGREMRVHLHSDRSLNGRMRVVVY